MSKTRRGRRCKELLVYCLHFERMIEGRLHYVGLTTCDGFQDRVRRHLTGRGSAFTRKAFLEGVGVVGVGHYHALSPTDERVIMALATPFEICPACSPQPGDEVFPLNLVLTDDGDVESILSQIESREVLASIRKPLRGLLW